MTTDWNPNADNVLGLEWLPSEVGHRIINGSSKCAAMNFTSTDTDVLDRIWLGLTADQLLLPLSGDWLLEVYETGDEIPGAVTTFTARPNGTTKNSGAVWKDETGTNVAIGAGVGGHIGETDLDVSDYVQYTGTYQQKTPLVLEFDTASFPSGKRVVGGRLIIVANRQDANGRLQVHLHRELENDNYGIGEITVDSEIREYSVDFPEICPWRRVSWSDDNIQDFDIHNPDVDGFTVRIKPIGIGKHKPVRIYQMYLEIDYVTENREAEFVPDWADSSKDWVPFNVQQSVTGGGSWDKQDSTDYTLSLRRIPLWKPLTGGDDLDGSVSEGGSIGWRYLAESAPVVNTIGRSPGLPDTRMVSYSPVLNADGTIASLGDDGARGYCFFLDRLSSAVDPVDGQPYIYFFVNCSDDGDTFQYLTTTTGGTYGLIRLVVGPRSEAVDPISISVKRFADYVQFGSTITLTVDDLLIDGAAVIPPGTTTRGNGVINEATLYLIELPFDTAPVLAAATDYYVQIEGPTGANTSWEVMLLSSNDIGVPTLPVKSTFGGDDSGANDATDDETLVGILDAPLTLVVQPDPVEDFAAVIATDTLITDTQATTAEWLIHDLEYASLTWTPTALSADFVRYEIERTTDLGLTWETIFAITDEAVSEARDYEGLRNVEAFYRIRVVVSWTAASEWSDEESVTAALNDCALLFVSNEDPTINQGYVDIGGSRTWKFLTADEKETHILVGRSYQVVTGPLEYRGDQFEVDLAVWAGSTPVDTGRARFDLIESLNSVATSYICVLDETGRRWLGDVTVTEGERPGTKTHIAKAKIIELTDTPSLVDIEV